MEHKKSLITLTLLIFAILVGCSSNIEQQVVVSPLFPERHGWDLKQVTISGDDTTLNFKRVDCVWVVGNDNKASDEPRVTALVDKLVSLAPQGLPAIGPDRFTDFKVGEKNFSRKVTLTFKDSSSFTLLIGTPGITKPVYVRLADKERIYWTDESLLKQINLDSSSWLAPKDS